MLKIPSDNEKIDYKQMKNTLTSLCLIFIASGFSILAEAPAGYYTSLELDGKNTSTLRTALQNIITTNHTTVGYSGLWNAYATTDINPSTGNIWDMYSNCSFTCPDDQNSGTNGTECTNYNREHTTPRSWFNSIEPINSDLFNVYPTDTYVNAQRSNYPYGEVGETTIMETFGNGSLLGYSNFSTYTGMVFEPIDEYKGDFARTFFYMATRYADICSDWASNSPEAAVVYGTNLGFTPYAIELFLKWSREDPVSEKEANRNDAVYTKQYNRNPFIDFLGLEEYIWGNKTMELFYVGGSTQNTPVVNSPSSANITDVSANLGGNITSTGNSTITESGIYYSLTDGFTNGEGIKITGSANDTGPFYIPVTGLNKNTNYYFKAFATNSLGTGYSSQARFITTGSTDNKISVGNIRESGAMLQYGIVKKPTTKSLLIKTKSITGNLTVAITGIAFDVSSAIINQQDAENGYTLYVTFNPTSVGSYTGTLTISGGGLVSNYQVNLSGIKQ